MKNSILSAGEYLIEAVRRLTLVRHATFNEQFQSWREDYVRRPQQTNVAMDTIRSLRESLFTGGRKFTRDEVNER